MFIYKNRDLRHTSSLSREISLYPYINLLFYLLPLLFPAGGFLSCSSGPPVPNPGVCVLETPKVNPADALSPGLLKLKPEVFDVPNPALRLPPDGLLEENPYDKPPVATPPNPGPLPNAPRLDEPKLVPIPEEKGVPKLAPKDACGPGAGCCC